jgi:serine/threonine-protein kinase
VFAAGQLIVDRYRLVDLLGEGGMGSVWRAHDQQRGIDVAVKVLRPGLASASVVRALFKQEAELSERMLSRHIVKVLERGIAPGGNAFIVFELLDGEDLGKRLDRDGSVPLLVCAEIVVQVCRALERAHAVGAVHRDIKPENIFLCRDERLVKVLDFGVASMMSSRAPERTPALSGTYEYIAPEHLIDGNPPDGRCDLYALGVVSYRALTGKLPFGGSSLGQLVLEISKGPAPAPSTFLAGLSPGLDAWFERAVHRDPGLRFQSAREMADAFASAYGSRSSQVSGPLDGPVVVRAPKRISGTGYSVIEPDVQRRGRKPR